MTSAAAYAIVGDVAVVTLCNPPVNALGHGLRAAIVEAVARAGADAAVGAVVLLAGERMFSAGADITEFGQPPAAPTLAEVLAAVENSAKPVVAAIRGAALGGGLELALACHGRIGAPSAKLGLPEVTLGLIPGAGGTQRLPRIVGAAKALEMITGGAPAGADAALAMGLLDALAGEDSLQEEAVAFARSVIGGPVSKVRDLEDRVAADRAQPSLFADFRAANAPRWRGAAAPEACVEAVEAAVTLPFAEGLALERRLFETLVAGEQSAAMRYAFFAERQAGKIAEVPDGTAAAPIRAAGVVGAGTMGGGIAMALANAGIPVTLVETNQEALDRGLAAVRSNYARSRSSTPETAERRMALITPSLDLAALAGCDLVIEAVFETMEVKKDVFAKLSGIVGPGATLASNTSYLDIDEIATAVDRPERFLGLHFFSPANVMKLLEVVRGAKTSPETLATAMALGRRLGKVSVPVGVCFGFVGNRMLAQRTAQANALLMEGALPWQVDRVLTDFGLPMGPFAMSDLAGLDLGWRAEASTSSTVREVLNEMGRRGQKTGAGFYDYDERRRPTPSAVVEEVITDFSRRQGTVRRAISDEEILQRCLYPMVNEGAKILEEGKAARASDIDVIWLNGYGWPRHRGGPMWWAEHSVGLAKVVAGLEGRGAAAGWTQDVSPLLRRLAEGGRGFAEA